MNYAEESLKLHKQWKGKQDIIPKMKIENKTDLSLAYTPGVAQPCLEIQKDINKSFELTGRWNTVAVITDGTAVLGLGDIGPEAGMPVMEGKCVLFKRFAGVDAIPLCIRSKEVDEIVKTVSLLSGSFGGINLEDISAPRCFEIEKKLKTCTDIPIFHDDQHGTAIVAAAALINALKIVKKELSGITVVINGAGSAGIAIAKFLLSLKVNNIIMCDKEGILYQGMKNNTKANITTKTNKKNIDGTLKDALKGADVFIGVSAGNVVTKDMIEVMAKDAIVLAMANPVPEIMPELAKEGGARIVGTGRSDFPNQINNVLAFPGIFRGALDVRASDINEEMKIAAAYAIASAVPQNKLSEDYIIPEPFDKDLGLIVGKAVADAARKSKVARI
ncbi:MAG: NAD-dependent malic enzyme [Clostridia bacterium]|nr:NAD-dependent malic enzyme [Clostridia bacterium]